jgi:hypothetical protein
MDRSSGRTLFIAAAAIVLVAIVVGAVVAFVVMGGDDDDNGDGNTRATEQRTETPSTGAPDAETPTALEPTPTRGPALELRAALEDLVRDELDAQYIGSCSPQGDVVQGICSDQLYLTSDLATYYLGTAVNNPQGEAVLLHDESGWTGTFHRYQMGDLAVGANVVVIGAGDCLNFRVQPNAGGERLTCQLDGTRGVIVDGPVQADDITWWQVEGYGWATAEYLRLAGG